MVISNVFYFFFFRNVAVANDVIVSDHLRLDSLYYQITETPPTPWSPSSSFLVLLPEIN